MRTSRISQETSRIISATPFSPPAKRKTRSSLKRFAQNGASSPKDEAMDAETPSDDIEDAIMPAGKRKRDENVTSAKRTSARKTVTVKTEIEESITFSPSPSKDRRVRKPARQVKNEDSGEVEIHPPSDWAEVYAAVKEMRTRGAAQGAAVDTMGCESLAEEDVNPRDKRYQTLTALMLSSQTKDTTNAVAMQRLKIKLPPYKAGAPAGLNLENILAVEPELLNELIWVVGFHNNKTRYIKAAAEILRDVWAGDIPDTIEGLMSLPGVGPKMAYLCLSSAWGRTEGIGVDVHVHRITNLWGWQKTKGPEETRLALQSWLPRELWHEINWLLVGFGQTICLPVGRKCGECELGLNGLCKAAERGKVIVGRKTREEKIVTNAAGEVVQKVETVDDEEQVVADGPVNAPSDVGVDVAGQEEVPVEEGLTKEEEREVNEEIANAAGDFRETPAKRRKR